MRFYTCIIGTELLNGRRKDAHFEFVNNELNKRGFEQWGSFIIKDEPEFIARTFEFIKNELDSVMFCFGGIGATPDDYTREVASQVFTGKSAVLHEGAAKLIIDRFGQSAYPNRINMAYIPENSTLLTNVVNQVPGFAVDKRFFFMPGFPQMAQAMVMEALDTFYPSIQKKYSTTFTALCSEENLIHIMKLLPKDIEFSSLPIMDNEKRAVELYLASHKENEIIEYKKLFVDEMKNKNIEWFNGGYFAN